MSPSILDVKKRYEDRLMAEPGVVSVGIGRDDEGNPVIVVGVERPESEAIQKLPRELDGYRVHIDVVGPLKAH